MNRRAPTLENGNNTSKWGYAIAGACAIAFAAIIQLAFDGLDETTLANMPALVAVPYGAAGKLGITVPLALLGIGLIARDGLANRKTGAPLATTRRRGAAAKTEDEELEIGEPILDEPAPASAGKKKIAALAGGFVAGAKTDGPVAHASVADGGGGQLVMASAKYMNANPGRGVAGGFRKGGTNNSAAEE